MYDSDEDRELKPLTRNVLEYFSNRCATLNMYKEGTSEYEGLWSELWCKAEEYQQMKNFIHIVQENGKEGVRNTFFNHWIVPPIFDKIVTETNERLNYIVIDDGEYGIVQSDGKGTLICPCSYDHIERLNNFSDLVKITMNGKYGIIELYSGDYATVRVEPTCDDVQETDGGYVILKKGGKCGLCKYGYVLPIEYERIFIPTIMGWIKVMKNGEWGYIDANNEFTDDMNNAYLYHVIY